MTPKILITIPAYNEEKMVGEIVKSTKALHPDYEVVVIDDGSQDKTVENAKEAGASIVSLPFHCGGGIAIQTGYMISAMHNFDYTVKLDADGQHRPEDIRNLLEPLFAGEADITVGSRYLESNGNNHDSSLRDGGRVFSSTLVSSVHKMEVTDITCGMRGWNKKAIETLLPIYRKRKNIEDSVFWLVETILAKKKGLKLKEVPIEILPRLHGKSKSFSPTKMLRYPVRLITTLLEETIA
jgi:glycosyltransferase involved in cell wall biosynthesis